MIKTGKPITNNIYGLDIFSSHKSALYSFNKQNLSQSKLATNLPYSINSPLKNQVYFELLLAIVYFIIIRAFVIFIFSGVSKIAQNRKMAGNRFKQTPCMNCRFYTNSHYLRCTVNPVIALTEQAINCSDYQPQD